MNLVFKRKHGLEGAKLAPFETIRIIEARLSHTRNVINDIFPHGSTFYEYEYICVGDEKQYLIFLGAELTSMLPNYDLLGG